MFFVTRAIRRVPGSSIAHASYVRRAYSTAPRASIKLVAEIRKRTENQTSLSKAREALEATSNDLEAALKWLEQDLIASGAKKAAKLEGRVAGNGLVASVVLGDGSVDLKGVGGVRAALVELNCETDFVARNEVFQRLAVDVAHTAAFLAEEDTKLPAHEVVAQISTDVLNDAPLIPYDPSSSSSSSETANLTVASAIRDAMTILGEKISLRRASAVVSTSPLSLPTGSVVHGLRLGAYTHGSTSTSSSSRAQAGSMASFVTLGLATPSSSAPSSITSLISSDVFTTEYAKLARSTARQVIGMETSSINGEMPSSVEEGTPLPLYAQPPVTYPTASLNATTVRDVLDEWTTSHVNASADGGKVEVLQFIKWKAGEGIEGGESCAK